MTPVFEALEESFPLLLPEFDLNDLNLTSLNVDLKEALFLPIRCPLHGSVVPRPARAGARLSVEGFLFSF